MTPENVSQTSDPRTALELRRPQALSLPETIRVAELLAASGFFKDSREMAQAATKVLAGSELGFGPIASMTGIHIVKDRVTVGANLIAAAIKRHPSYDYRVTEHTDETCVVEILEHGQLAGTSRFTMDDARRASLAGRENWRAHPRNMLFSRAVSNAAKWYCPDVLGGPAPYTPEELEDIDGDAVTVIDQRPEAGSDSSTSNEAAEDARQLTAAEADRLLNVIRGLTPSPTLDDVVVALAAVGSSKHGDPEAAVRTLTVGQACQLLEELHKTENAVVEQGATDLPWVEGYEAPPKEHS